MAALLLAGLLSVFAISYSTRAFWRCKRQRVSTPVDDDELERNLAERAEKLELGLSRRNVEALGRAALFGGTGCAVWELTSGSTHYLKAGIAFGFGLFGWLVCGEVHRRIGSLAGSQ